MIVSGESRTSWVPILLGVPQGSMLGPLLFILYTADIPTLFSKYSATGHLFADDVQAYVHGPPSSQLVLASKIELLSNELNSWMSSNRVSLNSAKTQLIWFGTSQQLLKLDHALLSDRFPHFTFHTTVSDLGVTLDSALTLSQHISNLTRSSYFQLRRLRTIRKAVYVPIYTSIVQAFVCSRIDYCNSLLIGLPKTRLSPLQTVLNAAARLIARLPRYSHISYYIKKPLHWLPISTRIEYKVLLIVLKAQMGVAPKYLRDVIRLPTSATSLRPLRSMDRRELYVPRTRTTMAMSRSFA